MRIPQYVVKLMREGRTQITHLDNPRRSIYSKPAMWSVDVLAFSEAEVSNQLTLSYRESPLMPWQVVAKYFQTELQMIRFA